MGAAITMKFQSRSLNKVLRSGDRPARKAAVDAINLAVRKELKGVYRKTAAELGVPQKIVRKRTYNSKAKIRRPAYVVRTVTQPVNLGTLGAKASSRVRGLKKGPITAKGAFLGNSPKGTVRAYKRKGAERFPLEMATLEIHTTVKKNLAKMNKRALRAAMRKHYPRQLRFRQKQARR